MMRLLSAVLVRVIFLVLFGVVAMCGSAIASGCVPGVGDANAGSKLFHNGPVWIEGVFPVSCVGCHGEPGTYPPTYNSPNGPKLSDSCWIDKTSGLPVLTPDEN